jgi:hypothetical protein
VVALAKNVLTVNNNIGNRPTISMAVQIAIVGLPRKESDGKPISELSNTESPISTTMP